MKISTLSVPYDEYKIPGLCLVGESKHEALEVAELALKFYETPGPKPSSTLSLIPSKEFEMLYEFVLSFGDVGSVKIEGLNGGDARSFLALIPDSPGYFICLGIDHENSVTLIDPVTFFLVKSEIITELGIEIAEGEAFDWKSFKTEFALAAA